MKRFLQILIASLVLAIFSSGAVSQPVLIDKTYNLELEAPSDPRIQHVSNRICMELARLNFHAECPRVFVASNQDHWRRITKDGTAMAIPEGTVLESYFNKTGWWDLIGIVDIHAHEILHRIQGTPNSNWTRWSADQLYWEEAAVEAVWRDVEKIVWKRINPKITGHFGGMTYEDRVIAFRSASAKATKSPWFSRKARSWRAYFLKANDRDRAALLAEVGLNVKMGNTP